MSVSASDIDWETSQPGPVIAERVFRERGEGRYSLELLPAGVAFEIERLRRSSKELWGELRVSVPASFRGAKTIQNGVLSVGDLNCSSVQARETRSKVIAHRSGMESLDWHGFLEEFIVRVIDAERQGKPAVLLAEEPLDEEASDSWDVQTLPILRDLPMVLFGSGGAAKSYLAMWIAGLLALKHDINVLYCDWEFSKRDHRKRLGLLFQPMPKGVFYATCDKPLVDEVDRIQRLIREHKCSYIICDSMVFALNGPSDDEHAGIYFRALRALKIGSLNIAHTTKADDDREKQVYGSVFFQNGARSIWFAQRAEQNPVGELNIGLYHRKSNVGELLKPKGFKLEFQRGRTAVSNVDVGSVDELAAKMPLLDRIRKALTPGALTYKQLADDTDATVPVIRKMASRHKSLFIKLSGNKVGLLSQSVEF